MLKEQILDIGIGSGGAYIERNTAVHEQRIGIDVGRSKMLGLRHDFPEVESVVASAEYIPFPTDTFSRIEIVLPFEDLMLPGLQNDHPALLEPYKSKYVHDYQDGWYPEFQRVLRPFGTMVLYGDIWLNQHHVRSTSQNFFDVIEASNLTVSEFCSLGTRSVLVVLQNGRDAEFEDGNNRWENTLVKIVLRSKKQGS